MAQQVVVENAGRASKEMWVVLNPFTPLPGQEGNAISANDWPGHARIALRDMGLADSGPS